MKIQNLYVGQTISNYKELCKILEVDYKKCTNSKNSDLKEFDRYCRYEKTSRGYRVNEIYPTPKKKVDGRSLGNNTKYAHEVTALILNYISTSNYYMVNGCNKVFELTNVEIFKLSGLCNEDYYEHQLDSRLCSEFKLKKDDINLFYYRTYRKLIEVTESGLNGVRRAEGVVSVTRIAKITTDDKPRLATIDELEIINREKNIVLADMDISYNKLHRTGRYLTFLENLNQILYTKYGWTIVLEAYEITISQCYVNSKNSYALENEKTSDFMRIVNSKIHHYFDSKVETLYRKFFKKKEDEQFALSDDLLSDDMGFIKRTSKKPFILSEEYVEKQQRLNERLIKLL